MKVVVDLDLHEAIADFAIRSPVTAYEFKSQDTVQWNLYFVQGGVVQDLGPSLALKYGMIKTGDTTDTILGFQTTFSYLTDSTGNVYYSGLVNYNNSAMASAITGKSSLNCTSEIRYQDAASEIIHSLDIPCIVFQTILAETGVTPPPPNTSYPDQSTLVLKSTIQQPNGVAGLDASGLLFTNQIPVDTKTIIINGAGKLASQAVLTTTAANFATPAVNATVSVTLASTTGLVAGQYVRIPIAGYYVVQSITDSTHAVLQNNGDPFNAISGTTITSGAVLLPAQAATAGGTAGANAYDSTTAAFTTPAVGANVTVQMHSTAWLGGNGYIVYIQGAGYYSVSSIVDGANASLTNLGYTVTNAAPGTVIAIGAKISPGGVQGGPGAAGNTGGNAYDATTASFTMPAAAATVTITISNTAWTAAGQEIYIAGAGYFSVTTVLSPTALLITNSNYPGAAAPGSTIASGSKVSPAGLIGPAGAGGAGLNAFTNLAANFSQPGVGGTVTINVGTTAWMAINQVIFVQGGGYYQVQTIGDLTHATVSNLGYTGNAASGATVTSGPTVGVTPGGLAGQGGNSFTVTATAYTQPAIGNNVTVNVVATNWMVQNQYVFINGGGTYQVVSITDATHVILQSVAATGNVTSGSTVPINSGVSPNGPPGPAGPQGATGPSGGISDAPSDGNTYGRKNAAWTTITSGGGGPFDPRTGYFLYEDFVTFGPTSTPYPYWSSQSVTGSAAAVNWALQNSYYDATHKAIGYVELQTGNVSGNSGAFLAYGSGLDFRHGMVLGAGIMDIASRMMIETSLPATGNGAVVRWGLEASNSLATWPFAYVRSVFLEYSPDNNSGNLRLGYNTASGAITYVNTSQALTADTFAWWELKIDTSGNITAYFNGVSIATASAISGLLGACLSPFWYVFRTGGTPIISIAIDTLFASMPYTR